MGVYKMSKKVLMVEVDKVSYTRAIRNKCLDCCAGNDAEVRRCELIQCPLFPYRFGCSPASAINKYKECIKIVPAP